MFSEEYLSLQKRRIEARLDWCNRIIRNRRIDALFKAQKVRPAQLLALARIESADYGLCSDCGDPIPKKRLNVVPATNRCIRCQEEVER